MDTRAGYGQQALEFVERLQRIVSAEAAMEAMVAAFAAFGFETLILTGLPTPGQPFEQAVLAKRWPSEWFEIYARNDYINADPVARLSRETLNPFQWTEAPYEPEREPRAVEVIQRARDFNMIEGFVVPIHGRTFDAAVSLGGTHLDLNPYSKPAIHLMAMYGFDRVRLLLDPSRLRRSDLTGRERETLAWASQGKSAWEIGEILGISQRTVEEHLAAAGRKLGAVNRVHAVAIGIRERVIEP